MWYVSLLFILKSLLESLYLRNRHGRYLGGVSQEPHENLVPKVTPEMEAQDVLPILKDKNGAPENTYRRRTKSMSREKRKISLDLINLDNGIETEAITGPVYNLLRALISSNGLLLWAKCAQSQAVTPDIVMILLGLSSWYNLEVVYYKLHQLFDIRVMF